MPIHTHTHTHTHRGRGIKREPWGRLHNECMHTWMFVCVCVCVCVCAYAFLSIRMHALHVCRPYAYLYICLYVCNACISVCNSMYALTYVRTNRRMNGWILHFTDLSAPTSVSNELILRHGAEVLKFVWRLWMSSTESKGWSKSKMQGRTIKLVMKCSMQHWRDTHARALRRLHSVGGGAAGVWL